MRVSGIAREARVDLIRPSFGQITVCHTAIPAREALAVPRLKRKNESGSFADVMQTVRSIHANLPS
jgi:hypothetical protein